MTASIQQLSKDIWYELGILAGAKLVSPTIELRRKNKIKTIQSSLAIEGNTLSLDQVIAILDGKKVLAPEKEIIEVQNAIKVYDNLLLWDPLSAESLKQAHKLLMANLVTSNGNWRERSVGIFKNASLAHMAPPANRVPILMDALFKFITTAQDVSWLLKACIFHYELEFIHPFEDGNGRMGRLWQQLLLMKENPVFEFISTESLIKQNQEEYYNVLEACDKQGESTQFIEFSLKKILATLKEYTDLASPQVMHSQQRIAYTKTLLTSPFSRKQYMAIYKNISTATASRDLAEAVKNRVLNREGEGNQMLYIFN